MFEIYFDHIASTYSLPSPSECLLHNKFPFPVFFFMCVCVCLCVVLCCEYVTVNVGFEC